MKNSFKERACKDESSRTFFPDTWQDDKIPFTLGLGRARNICSGCPVRAACLAMEMEAEASASIDHRFGIFGGFTPQQRYSLEKRGQGVECTLCGALRDPNELRAGQLTCRSCGVQGEMLPLPDHGDQWTDRHTKMAETVIAWLVENVEPDGLAPTSAQLSRKLSLRVNDMRRVYAALEADQILEATEAGIVRRATASATKGWAPRHLRIDA
jgi:hypothetical protein